MRTWLAAFVVVLTLLGLGGARTAVQAQAEDGAATGQPPVGTAVPIVGAEGGEVARITVTEVEDPFEDYDSNAAPERSYHFVLLHLDIENTGNRPFTFNSFGVTLQDTEGFLYQQAFIFRTPEQIEADPEFSSEDIEAGDTASGVIGFQVLNGAELVRVVFQPEFDRLIFLADLTIEGAAPPADDASDTATPAATDDADDADDADTDDSGDTDDADADAAPVDLSAAECDDIEAWLEESTPALDALEETLTALLAEDPIPASTLADAADNLADAADDVRDSDPPAAVEDAATALADGLDAYADALAEAAESGEDISFEDFASTVDTDEAEDLIDDAFTLSEPVIDACGIDL